MRPKKYVVSRTLEKPIWRNTTIIRDNVVEAVQRLKATSGRSIPTDGSSQLVRTLLAHVTISARRAGDGLLPRETSLVVTAGRRSP